MTQYASGSSKATRVQWEFWKSSQIHYSVQAIYMHEDKGSNSRRADPMDVVVCVGRISGYLEGECVRRPGGRAIRIQVSRRVFSRYKEYSFIEEFK